MKLYGIVINICGFEQTVKLVEQDVYDWVTRPVNPKAIIDLVPFTVYNKIEEENKYMKYFREGTNEIVKPVDYEDLKAEIAPAFKSGFDSLEEAAKYATDNGYTYADSIIVYLQS